MSIDKTIVTLVVFGLGLTCSYHVEAQQPVKVRTIGFLNQTGAFSANVEAFRQGMRELGYIEGQNIVIEFRSGERGAQLAQLANELVQQKVDVIVTSGPATSPAKMATAARMRPAMLNRSTRVPVYEQGMTQTVSAGTAKYEEADSG